MSQKDDYTAMAENDHNNDLKHLIVMQVSMQVTKEYLTRLRKVLDFSDMSDIRFHVFCLSTLSMIRLKTYDAYDALEEKKRCKNG